MWIRYVWNPETTEWIRYVGQYYTYDENGNEIKTTYGIVRIPDTMALEEMKQYE